MKDPEILAELKRIAENNDGQLRPADVVKAARPKSSVLHSRFEWNDGEAAEKYRLWQARQLIRVSVEYVGAGQEAVLTKVFVNLTTDRAEGTGYRTINAVMSDPQKRRQLLDDALHEMRHFQLKYKELTELAAVFKAMDKALQQHDRSTVGPEVNNQL